MFNFLVHSSLANRLVVLAAAAVMVVWGVMALRTFDKGGMKRGDDFGERSIVKQDVAIVIGRGCR